MNQIIGGTTIRLHQDDNVVVAAQNIGAGATIPGEGVVTGSAVPSGHKIATRAIPAGDYVRKYNQIIGVATADIAPGAHVHVQNCAMSDFERDYARMQAHGVRFHEAPRREAYGTVVVFEDLYGNRWDLLQPASS